MPAGEAGWMKPLTRILTLKAGRRLTTLLDAADLLAERFLAKLGR
jgi:hypothetical protein